MADPKETDSIEDVQLALGCRLLEGDGAVLGDILREFGPAVEAAIGKRFPSFKFQDLEDVLMITLDRLWKSRSTYDDSKCSLRGWLFVIAYSVAQDVLKMGWHQAKNLERPTSDAVFEEVIRNETLLNEVDPSPAYAKRVADLDAVLSRLTEEERRIILSYAGADGQGDWAAALAEDTEMAAGTIRVKRLRILERIKTEMRTKGHQIS